MKKILILSTLKLVIGGIIIGVFHQYDLVLAIVLGLKIIHSIYSSVKNNTYSPIFVAGLVFTGLMGVLVEHLGTTYNHWEYHDVTSQVPKWLFFGWAGAFVLMYRIEVQIYTQFPNLSNATRNSLILLMALFFPALGEMIAINLGTWTYFWPYQLFGVPLLAIVGLTFIHYFTHVAFSFISKKLGIKDVVFNPIQPLTVINIENKH
ncbi:hypothetical protein V1T75_02850 [Tenacibaculum sp. FZY0031]|uniref:hypothetical protein n=1 Tax=Tenacibaculum sp. FZY0031 TaxID=3116648 RepID=UPI002EBF7139|nr:hypothetical protein [Tenacibaculum sp. FZY0031]